MINRLNSFLEEYSNKIKAAGEELRILSMPPLTEELFALYENTGNRLKYEAVYFLRRKYLAVFGMLSILYKRKEDIKKLEEVLTAICLEECWALPPHVNREENKNWRITIDLFASETAQAVTEICAILKEELSDEVKVLVRDNVLNRVIQPFYNAQIPYSGWEVCNHNWCAVCAGSIGSASLFLFSQDENKLNQYMERICSSLTHYIDGFPEDGTCMEGISYFTYGMTYYVTFAAQIYEYSKGKIDLFHSEKLRKIGEFQQKCYFGGGITINFSDGSSHDKFKMGLTSYLALRYPTIIIPNMDMAAEYDTDPCFRWAAIYRDYIWTRQYIVNYQEKVESNIKSQKVIEYKNNLENQVIVEGKREIESHIQKEVSHQHASQIVLPDAGWSISKSKNGAGFAIKGGHNQEPHNHNDVGSFLYVNQKDMLLMELGAGEYTKDYFSDKRYTILCNSSLGHNVPLINGGEQQTGKDFCCTRFETDGNGKTILDIGKAYEQGTIDSLERSTYFNLENGETIIRDKFQGSHRLCRVTENLVTKYPPIMKDNIISIQGEDSAIRIEVKNLDSTIRILTKVHSDHSGNEVMVYLLQWEVILDQGRGYAEFVIYPEVNTRITT